MAPPRKSMSDYRYHISGQAVVTLDGKDFYLGPHDSAESRSKCFALIQEYNANGLIAPDRASHQADAPISVRCVTAEFREHIKTKYATNKQELDRFRNLCTTLEDEYGDEPAADFGPRKLATLRELFVVSGNCRRYVNRQTRNIILIFKYGVSRELVTPDRLVALQSLEPLRFGQTKAKESTPVTAATVVREALGVEAAQALLGHSRPMMTEHYAKISEKKAVEAAHQAPRILIS